VVEIFYIGHIAFSLMLPLSLKWAYNLKEDGVEYKLSRLQHSNLQKNIDKIIITYMNEKK
jgi:hypothetical protein